MQESIIHITAKSSNAKTGKIPVTTSDRSTCPDSCPLKGKGGCYGEAGPLKLHWDKVDAGQRGNGWADLVAFIDNLPGGQVWRHNQAGDLPHNDQVIDQVKLQALLLANRGKDGFTYTHHDMAIKANRDAVAMANSDGFTVNLSANNLQHADELSELEIGPVAVVLPADQTSNTTTPAGRRVTICPAVTKPGITCATCKLCAKAGRSTIVGLPAHGSRKKAAGSH